METLTYIKNKSVVTVARGLTAMAASFNPHPDEVVQIPSRDEKRTIKTHLYRPKVKAQQSDAPSPVVINFHGSGFVFPMHGSDSEFCRYIADNTHYTVIDSSYRLAPENPFPAAPNDAEDVINWVLNQPQMFDLSQVAICGFSAGANLALVACSSLFPKGTFKSVVAFYPPTDLSKDPGLKIAPDPSGSPIPAFAARFFDQCYIPKTVDTKDPRVSPSFAPPDNFPSNILVITCAFDTLALEAEELAAKIKVVPDSHVIQRRMEGCNHAWNLDTKEGTPQDEAKIEAYQLVVELLKS